MRIRKLFSFENAHIVRDCSTQRCSQSLHGHSYEVEVLLESNFLDHGQMVYDFGLMKTGIKDIIDSFDHAVTLYEHEPQTYKDDMKKHSKRWIQLPVSPSAEQFARVFFLLIERLLAQTVMQNGEKEVKLYSIIVHETKTGYAQCFSEDAHSELMGKIALEGIVFSSGVQAEWKQQKLFARLLSGDSFINPATV
ncbi:MAG: 6-pyruvoyl trahydropterin synthase family protein [Campylobacterota bacterium]